MKKGIMFTTDAVLALIAVMLFLAWIPYQMGSQSGSQVFENISDQARDKAIINFYEGNSGCGSNCITSTAKFGKCFAVYSIDPTGNIGSPAPIIENIFCEEA